MNSHMWYHLSKVWVHLKICKWYLFTFIELKQMLVLLRIRSHVQVILVTSLCCTLPQLGSTTTALKVSFSNRKSDFIEKGI